MKINKLYTTMLPLLLLSGGCAEAQTKDVSSSDSGSAVEAVTPNVSVDGNGKLDMEALLAQAQAKRDKSAAELAREKAETAQEKAETLGVKELLSVAEKPDVKVSVDGKLDMEALLEQAKAKRDKSALELSQTSAEVCLLAALSISEMADSQNG